MTIREALTRLGMEEVTRMVTIFTQKALYASSDKFIRNFRSTLWQHSLVCAMACQWVAQEAKFEELTQEVFFAALIA